MIFKSRFIFILAAGLFFFISTGISFYSIYKEVRSITLTAKSEFGPDPVIALLSLVQSENFSFRDRNRAVWALGQIGDKRALPVLMGLDIQTATRDGLDPDQHIVKYTVEKAIDQIEGFIITRWMYEFL
ncbi:HEAT repeat domain-containing protein [Desulfospira joergensenii]|uniref:HEAT repeat domain-containing protein n=1 Tax=Desulfospira joergensenii TaxID=53329 RepID=UPI0003B4A8A5|nr:HEAT repeat domain-containing protein [Desulfospira joergensenii]